MFLHKWALNSQMTNENIIREVKAADLWSVRTFGCLSFGTSLLEPFLQTYCDVYFSSFNGKNMQYNFIA